MSALPLNRLWSRAVLARLMACGVRDVVLCHGGRSAAFAMEASNTEGLRTILRIDERAGGFFALGLVRASGRPVAVVTTSGSAVANTLPALAEAWTGGGAVVLVSCDRPDTARAEGAPQTLAHLPLTASVVAAQHEFPEPAAEPAAFAELVAGLDRVLQVAIDRNQPVHLNLPLNGDISSVQPEDQAALLNLLPEGLDRALTARQPVGDGPDEIDAWVHEHGAGPGQRGVIAVGSHPEISAEALAELAKATGYPLIVDAGSGLRGELGGCLTLCDIAVFHPAVAGQGPEVVLHAGKPMTSPFLERWLKRPGARRLALDHVRARGLSHDAPQPPLSAEALRRLKYLLGHGDSAWAEQFAAIDQASNARAEGCVEAIGWNEASLVYHALHREGFDRVFFASSLAVRMGNLWVGAGQQVKVDVNRGLNGIDGTLSTFLGTLTANGERGLLVVGDQAFLHDLPALEQLEEPPPGVILLMDNSGPGLLDLVVWNTSPEIRAALHRPTIMDVESVARAFGLQYASASDMAALSEALEQAPDGGLSIIHAKLADTGFEQAVSTLARGLLGFGA